MSVVRPCDSFGQAHHATPGPPGATKASDKRSQGFSSRHKGPDTGYYSSSPQITLFSP